MKAPQFKLKSNIPLMLQKRTETLVQKVMNTASLLRTKYNWCAKQAHTALKPYQPRLSARLFSFGVLLSSIGVIFALRERYSGRWFQTVLNQNLPALSQLQKRISWETLETVVAEQLASNTQQTLSLLSLNQSPAIERIDVYSNFMIIRVNPVWDKLLAQKFIGVSESIPSQSTPDKEQSPNHKAQTRSPLRGVNSQWYTIPARGVANPLTTLHMKNLSQQPLEKQFLKGLSVSSRQNTNSPVPLPLKETLLTYAEEIPSKLDSLTLNTDQPFLLRDMESPKDSNRRLESQRKDSTLNPIPKKDSSSLIPNSGTERGVPHVQFNVQKRLRINTNMLHEEAYSPLIALSLPTLEDSVFKDPEREEQGYSQELYTSPSTDRSSAVATVFKDDSISRRSVSSSEDDQQVLHLQSKTYVDNKDLHVLRKTANRLHTDANSQSIESIPEATEFDSLPFVERDEISDSRRTVSKEPHSTKKGEETDFLIEGFDSLQTIYRSLFYSQGVVPPIELPEFDEADEIDSQIEEAESKEKEKVQEVFEDGVFTGKDPQIKDFNAHEDSRRVQSPVESLHVKTPKSKISEHSIEGKQIKQDQDGIGDQAQLHTSTREAGQAKDWEEFSYENFLKILEELGLTEELGNRLGDVPAEDMQERLAACQPFLVKNLEDLSKLMSLGIVAQPEQIVSSHPIFEKNSWLQPRLMSGYLFLDSNLSSLLQQISIKNLFGLQSYRLAKLLRSGFHLPLEIPLPPTWTASFPYESILLDPPQLDVLYQDTELKASENLTRGLLDDDVERGLEERSEPLHSQEAYTIFKRISKQDVLKRYRELLMDNTAQTEYLLNVPQVPEAVDPLNDPQDPSADAQSETFVPFDARAYPEFFYKGLAFSVDESQDLDTSTSDEDQEDDDEINQQTLSPWVSSLLGPDNVLSDRRSDFFGKNIVLRSHFPRFQRQAMRQRTERLLSDMDETTIPEGSTKTERLLRAPSFIKKLKEYPPFNRQSIYKPSLPVPSKRYLDLPHLTPSEWYNIFKAELHLHLAKEAVEATQFRAKAENIGKEYKVRQIAVFVPSLGMRKPQEEAIEWPLTRLEYQKLDNLWLSSQFKGGDPKRVNHTIPTDPLVYGRIFERGSLSFHRSNRPASHLKGSPPFLHVLNFEPITRSSWLALYQIMLALWVRKVSQYLYRVALKGVLLSFLRSLGRLGIDSRRTLRGLTTTPPRILFHPNKRFQDVAGIDNIIPELGELVWFLRNSGRGVNTPRGTLLVGPPGSGKTFLIQAIAGEAEVPVIYESVTVGSKGDGPLKRAFNTARRQAPCILFLDEIDSIGAYREGVLLNSRDGILEMLHESQASENDVPFLPELENDEDEDEEKTKKNRVDKHIDDFGAFYTEKMEESRQRGEVERRRILLLGELLKEMDGLRALKGVVVIGATNRPDILDPALLRPGRFERIIDVGLPGKQKRIDILKLYSSNIGITTDTVSGIRDLGTPSTVGCKGSETAYWDYLSTLTMGLTAADLASAMNHSAIRAIIQETSHTIETVEYGLNSIMGSSEQNREPCQDSKELVSLKSKISTNRIAYYQAGKAVVHTKLPLHPQIPLLRLCPDNEKLLQKNSLGLTQFVGTGRRIDFETRLIGFYAGKAAELLGLSCKERTHISGVRQANQKRDRIHFNSQESKGTLSWGWQSDLGFAELLIASSLAHSMVDKWYFYSQEIAFHKANQTMTNKNLEEFQDPETVSVLDQFSNLLTQRDMEPPLAAPGAEGFWWQAQILKPLEVPSRGFSKWFRIFVHKAEQNVFRNDEWLPADQYFHQATKNQDLSQTLPSLETVKSEFSTTSEPPILGWIASAYKDDPSETDPESLKKDESVDAETADAEAADAEAADAEAADAEATDAQTADAQAADAQAVDAQAADASQVSIKDSDQKASALDQDSTTEEDLVAVDSEKENKQDSEGDEPAQIADGIGQELEDLPRDSEKRESKKQKEGTSFKDWNEFYLLNRDYAYQSLIMNCFGKASLILDQNRELLDSFAYYLLRLHSLRQYEILEIFSRFQQESMQDTDGKERIEEESYKSTSTVGSKTEQAVVPDLVLPPDKAIPPRETSIEILERYWGPLSRPHAPRFMDFSFIKMPYQ